MTNAAREFKSSQHFELETSIGPVKLIPTDADHVYATTDLDRYDGRNSGAHYEGLVVNRVPYRVSFHMHRLPTGWGPKDYTSLYASRADGQWKKDVTPAARKKLTQILSEEIGAWIAAHPEHFTSAAEIDRNNKALRLEEEIADLEKQLAAKRAELAAVLAGRA